MGMFDYFCIDNKWIPEGKQMTYEDQDYQTKSLDCMLDVYEVTGEGVLLKTKRLFDDPDEGEKFESVDFTGEIHFYSYPAEFKAWCVNGIVKEVIDISEPQTTNHEIKS